MDKIATNNFIVGLRKDVKAAKSMVAGNLTRKIKDHKATLEKLEDAEQRGKIEKKIEALHADTKRLKTLEEYPICKAAILKPDPKHWEKLIGDSKATPEDQLMARVISKNKIQKQVANFRSEHKDCDEWIEEYFEFREKKRELTEVKIASRKIKSKEGGPSKHPQKKGKFEKQPFSKGANRRPGAKHNISSNNNNNNKRESGGERPSQPGKEKEPVSGRNHDQKESESLHPSWASKRREKELLKAALSGKVLEQPKRIVLNSE